MTKTNSNDISFDVPPKKQVTIAQARCKYKAISAKWFTQKSDDERLLLLLDVAVGLNLDLDGIRNLRNEFWHSVLTEAYKKSGEEWNIAYEKYLSSDAWKEKRNEYFRKFGVLCICGRKAIALHHKTYENVGKENIERDLTGLCKSCHHNIHN